ncbi:MAG TPA: HAD family hydrolase, partial [Thiothrix sp.]|nr:HAD family hydrolase [Thiothrix sp.]
VIAAGDIVPAKKPAPDIYTYTLEKMGLHAEECLAFEDSENGILSSAAANIPTLITTNAYTEQHDFSPAALVVNPLGEPNQPFTVKQGDALGFNYVNADLLVRLHGAGVA